MKNKIFIIILSIFLIHVTELFCQNENLSIVLPSQKVKKSEVIPISKHELKLLKNGHIKINELIKSKKNGVIDTIK